MIKDIMEIDAQTRLELKETNLTILVKQAMNDVLTVRAKAEESLKSAKLGLAEAQAAVVAKTKEAALATDEYVRANPWESVGVAAAVGLVIGMLIARR